VDKRTSNSNIETRNPKWFDLLATLSHIEGQSRMTKIQMSQTLASGLSGFVSFI
jgi:hypothetical protein